MSEHNYFYKILKNPKTSGLNRYQNDPPPPTKFFRKIKKILFYNFIKL